MYKGCTIYRTADFMGKKWTLLILLEMYRGSSGPKRYSQIKRALPEISPKVLSMRLKELEKEGMIEKRTDASSLPVKCEYSLTKSGRDFMRIIKGMKRWALRWKFKSKICDNMNCRDCRL